MNWGIIRLEIEMRYQQRLREYNRYVNELDLREKQMGL